MLKSFKDVMTIKSWNIQGRHLIDQASTYTSVCGVFLFCLIALLLIFFFLFSCSLSSNKVFFQMPISKDKSKIDLDNRGARTKF